MKLSLTSFRHIRTIAKWIPLVALCLLASSCPDSIAGERHGSLIRDGIERTYRIFTPITTPNGWKVPLVIVLHGGGSTGNQAALYSRFDELARKERFIAVYPDAYEHHWNDGRKGTSFPSQQENIDDVGFIFALTWKIRREHTIDTSRIYVTGMSNGGMMTYRLACELPFLFAAAAPVIANLPEDLEPDCNSTTPIPMLIINGEDDPIMPWDGGEIGPELPEELPLQHRGRVISAEDTALFWAARNQCKTVGEKTYLPDSDPFDDTRVWVLPYTNGAQDSDVLLYGVEGGGHTWPGSFQYLPAFAVGEVSNDIDATQVIWEWFSAHSRD